MKVHTGLMIACVLSVAFSAAANDRKAYHGANCFVSFGPGVISALTGAYADGGSAIFHCPLIRDRINSASSLGVDSVSVEGYNNGSYTCQLVSQTEDDLSGGMLDFETESTSTTGRVQLNMDVALTSGNEGSISVWCNFSAGSYLYHIHVDENDNGAE